MPAPSFFFSFLFFFFFSSEFIRHRPADNSPSGFLPFLCRSRMCVRLCVCVCVTVFPLVYSKKKKNSACGYYTPVQPPS